MRCSQRYSGLLMTIDVELFGHLAPEAPRRQSITSSGPTTVADIVAHLGVDPEAVGLITVNGILSELDAALPPGSRLCLFPPLSGG